ncbi:hypothetical protein BGX28_010457 [Mortierella sp. GBA30]|nr:hypothetical protein BGX28_010457 [Mortierella sp. GBA30]
MEEVNDPTSAAPAQGTPTSASFSAPSSSVEPASPLPSRPQPPQPYPHSDPQPHPDPSKIQHHLSSATSSTLLPTPPASYSSSSGLALPPTATTLTRQSDQRSSSFAVTQHHGPDPLQSIVTGHINKNDMGVDQIEQHTAEEGDVDETQDDDLSSLSSSSSMDEQDEQDENQSAHSERERTKTTNRRPSFTSFAQKRIALEESHSDSDSQSFSVMDSHPNSESDSERDPESRPHSPQPVPARGHDSTTTTAPLSPHAVRRDNIDMQRHSHAVHNAQSKDMGLDRTMDQNEDQDLLSTLAEVAHQMPRREIPADRSAFYDSNATASESEG